MKVEITRVDNGVIITDDNGKTIITEERLQEDYFQCAVCGEWHPKKDQYGIVNGHPFCKDCFDDEKIHFCDHCQEYTTEDMTEVDGDNICQSCLDSMYEDGDFIYCEFCNEYHYSENAIYLEDAEAWMCEHCQWNREYYTCEDCGRHFKYDDSGEWNEDDDCWYCESCAEDHHGCIADYHNMKDNGYIEFYGDDEESLHMGVELELAGGYNVREIAQYVCDNFNGGDYEGFFNPERDCSVAVEIISQPATRQYWESIRPKLDNLFEIIKDNGHNLSGNNGAGGHIHCDRDWFKAQPGFTNWGDIIMKLQYIFHRYYYELLAFARRPFPAGNWGISHHYYKRPEHSSAAIRDAINNGTWIEEANDRYYALNIINRATIEFRIFGCYESSDRLMAYLKFAERLCTLSVTKTISEIRDMSFEDIIDNDEDIRAIWVAERSRFFDYIRDKWDTVSQGYKDLYLDEYPDAIEVAKQSLNSIKEAI